MSRETIIVRYNALQEYLAQKPDEIWNTTFSEIEKILGFKLPDSARHKRLWWANDRGKGSHTRAWIDVGWHTQNVSIGTGVVQFRRLKKNQGVKAKKIEQITLHKKNSDSGVFEWDKSLSLECKFGMEWKPAGKISLGPDDKLILPKVGENPGLYRFRIRSDNSESLYIGETDNLDKRFSQYRHPSPIHQTNLRMRAFLKYEIQNGAEVSVSVVNSGAWLDTGEGCLEANLSSKLVRCLLETAAILQCGDTNIEILNRAR